MNPIAAFPSREFLKGSLPAIALACAAFAGAAPARAATISYVQVLTSSFGGLHNQYDSINGQQQQTSNGPNINGTVTASVGPTNASVTLNSSSFSPNNGISESSAASAYANLALGTVGVSSSGSASVNNEPALAEATAQAAIQDTLTFHNLSGHVVDIDVYWTFDGTISTTSDVSRTDFGSYFCFATPVTSCQAQGGIGGGGIIQPASGSRFNYQYSLVGFGGLSVTTPSSGWATSSYTSSPLSPGGTLGIGVSNIAVTFHGVYALAAGTSTEGVYGSLTDICGGGMVATQGCDFSHTGSLSFSLNDPGVSFTSASGTLLTGAGAVPEPAEWSLVVIGLGLLAGGMTKRRRRA